MFNPKIPRFVAAALLVGFAGLIVGSTPLTAPSPEIILDVADTTARPGETLEIPVYLSNCVDTIAGFNFWVQLDRPDIMEFTTAIGEVIDTTYWICTDWSGPDCIDSVIVGPGDDWDFIHIDTNEILIGTINPSGALVENWEYLESRSLAGMGYDLYVVGIANLPAPPMTPGIAPQEGGILIKLVGQVYDIPDSMTDRTVNIVLQTTTINHFGFSDPHGNSIGVVCDTIPDTTFWRCLQWAGDICLEWAQVSGPPYDSISIEGYDLFCYLDTSIVHVFDGSVTVGWPILYGDADCDGAVNIADLVYIVDYMFAGGPPMPCLENVDCDYDGLFNITDLICLVEWMFPPME